MDARTFIAFRSSLTSRRGTLSLLGGGLLGTWAGGLDDQDAAARKTHRNRKRKARRQNRKKRNDSRIRLDATCPGASALTRRAFVGDERLAQTFTAINGGPLVKVTLPIGKDFTGDEGGDFVLRLSPLDGSGLPTNDVLAEAIVPSDAVSDVSDDIEFLFADPFSLEAGNDYALVLTRPGGDGFIWRQHQDNRCGGTAFDSEGQTEPFVARAAIFDQIFATFVRS